LNSACRPARPPSPIARSPGAELTARNAGDRTDGGQHKNLEALGVDPDKHHVVTRDQVKYAKPDPDLFLAAAARLDVAIERSIVVGDSIWDVLAATRCRAMGVGLLSGGYGPDELRQAGAIRVYEDPSDLLNHIDEV
jgi:phosphoglycolate phosphatase-like HAD superfamily hydrolase